MMRRRGRHRKRISTFFCPLSLICIIENVLSTNCLSERERTVISKRESIGVIVSHDIYVLSVFLSSYLVMYILCDVYIVACCLYFFAHEFLFNIMYGRSHDSIVII